MDKKYKNIYRHYLRLIKENCLYIIPNEDIKGHLVGYNPKGNYFLFQLIDHGWSRSNIQKLIDQNYIVSKTIKTPPSNLWNVNITSNLIRKLFKQQSLHN
jgi:hypothetical protein